MEQLYTILLNAQFISAGAVFLLLYFISAPYGRYSRGGWGPSVSARAGWFVMELPAVLVILYFYLTGHKNTVLTIFLLIWEFHYVQRALIYPFLIKGGKKSPLLIVLFAMIFNVMNGFINGYYLFYHAGYSPGWLTDPRFVCGLMLFLAGWCINIHSDHVLRSLRKPGETAYKIPDKGLHKLVASPNYLGEIMEWAGWAVLTWSLPGVAFLVFTAANLIPRAHRHRQWYRNQFADYPPNRKRIIPFVY